MSSQAKLKAASAHNKQTNSSTDSATEQCSKKACTPSSSMIEWEHGDKTARINIMKPRKDKKPHRIEVVATSQSPKKVTLKVAGKCECGRPKDTVMARKSKIPVRPNDEKACPSVRVFGPPVVVEQGNVVEVELLPAFKTTEDWRLVEFILFCFNADYFAKTYDVTTRSCNGIEGETATIAVYPYAKADITLNYGYYGKAVDRLPNTGRITDTQAKPEVWSGFSLSINVNAQYDQKTWSYSRSPKESGEGKEKDAGNSLAFDGFLALKGFLEKSIEFLKEVKTEDVDVDIGWPKLSLQTQLELSEGAENRAGVNGTIFFGFDPLLETNFTADVLNVLLRRLPVGKVIKKVKDKAEQGVKLGPVSGKAALGIELKATGKISGGWEWKKEIGKEATSTGKLNGEIGFTFAGEVEVEVDIFELVIIGVGGALAISGEESASTPCGFSVELLPLLENGKVMLNGKLDFTGMALFYVKYKKANVSTMESERTETRRDKTATKQMSNETKIETERKIITIIPKASLIDCSERRRDPTQSCTTLLDKFIGDKPVRPLP